MECLKMDYNQEILQMPAINYDPGKIDQLKQKGYLNFTNTIPNATFNSPLPQRKKRVLKIINPETGNEIFEDLKKKSENSQENPVEEVEESSKEKQQDTTNDNKSPSLENINNNRVTVQSSVHNDNTFTTAKSSSYLKSTDTYPLNVFSQKFTSNYNSMFYNQPFYPPSDHLLSYQNIPSNYHQQPYLYPYRNLPYYNPDVCYYPPINAQNNNGLLKNDRGSALQTVNQSSEESLADIKNENKTPANEAAETCKEKNEEEEKEKTEEDGEKVAGEIKEEKDEKKDTTSEKANEKEEKEEATPSGSKNLDPNAKSFIYNGVLPNINFMPDYNSIRRYSNPGYNVDFVENERWIPKVSDKSRLVLGGATSTPRLMRSDSEGDGLDKVVVKEEGGSNKSGRIQYSREFLLNLQYEPDSLKIPKDPIIYPEIIQTGLHPHHMRIRMKKQQQCMDYNHSHFQHNNLFEQSNNNNTLKNSSISMPSVIDRNTPSQIKNIFTNSLQQQPGRHIKGKSLQQQQQQILTPKKIIQVPIEKNVKLHHANNAWRPKTASTNDTIQADENTIMDLYKKVRGILNKLTPQKFDTLIQQVHDLSINTEEKLKGCIKLIFEKAIGEPSFSLAYAKMAKSLNNLKVHMDGQPEETVTFRKLLLNQCQKEFEKDKAHQQDLEKLSLLIEKAPSDKDKQRLLETKEQAEKMAKRRSLGNIRFIGELFRLKMLTENIMFECISRLLRFSADEDNVECLCRLLTTIGRDLEVASPTCKQRLDVVFEEVAKLANKKELSSRMKFMLQDVMELRSNSWVPRRDDNQPKTIEQIHREAELEHKLLAGEKRSVNSVQKGSFPTQKKFVFEQHRLDIRANGVKGRGKDEKLGVPRAVVGCGVRSLVDPIKNTTFKTRNSVPEISSDSKMKEMTLQEKTQISKDIKTLTMSNSADSLMHRAVHCEETAVTTGV